MKCDFKFKRINLNEVYRFCLSSPRSRHSLNQSNAKLIPIVTCSVAFLHTPYLIGFISIKVDEFSFSPFDSVLCFDFLRDSRYSM